MLLLCCPEPLSTLVSTLLLGVCAARSGHGEPDSGLLSEREETAEDEPERVRSPVRVRTGNVFFPFKLINRSLILWRYMAYKERIVLYSSLRKERINHPNGLI